MVRMAEPEQLCIGVATEDITPPPGVALAGYGTRSGRAAEVGHPLRAEALACRQGDGGWVLVTADAIGFPCDLVARVRQQVAAATGLPEAAIVLAATHTHSAPAGLRTYAAELEPVDHACREQAEAALAAVAAAAWAGVEPGTFEAAWTEAGELAHNRRVIDADGRARNEWEDPQGRHTGYCDPAVLLVGVRRPDGRRAAVVVNYGCHPVTLGPASTAISADYVGYLKDYLEEAAVAEVALFALAGAANINPRIAIRTGAEFPRAMGRALGARCAAALAQARPLAGGPVRTCRVPWEFVGSHAWPPSSGRRQGGTVRTEVMALRAGDLFALTAPGELFSELATEFRRLSPSPHTLVISLANDAVGYLVTDQTAAEGALEAMRAAGQAIEQPLLEGARAAVAGVAG